MKYIKLRNGYNAMVDNEDYELISKFTWRAFKSCKNIYAVTTQKVDGKLTSILMHRMILNAIKGKMVDHKDNYGLNNRKKNLRFCTNSENQKNKRAYGSSKFLGVSWHKPTQKWICHININGKQKHLGVFKNEKEAALKYNEWAIIHHKEFAKLNIIRK